MWKRSIGLLPLLDSVVDNHDGVAVETISGVIKIKAIHRQPSAALDRRRCRAGGAISLTDSGLSLVHGSQARHTTSAMRSGRSDRQPIARGRLIG